MFAEKKDAAISVLIEEDLLLLNWDEGENGSGFYIGYECANTFTFCGDGSGCVDGLGFKTKTGSGWGFSSGCGTKYKKGSGAGMGTIYYPNRDCQWGSTEDDDFDLNRQSEF